MEPEKLSGEPESLPHQSESDRPKWQPRRLGHIGRQWSHRPFDPIAEDRSLWLHHRSVAVGESGFDSMRSLTENGQKLYEILLGDDLKERDLLPIYAAEKELNLEAAIAELRKHSLLDESDPDVIRLIRKRL